MARLMETYPFVQSRIGIWPVRVYRFQLMGTVMSYSRRVLLFAVIWTGAAAQGQSVITNISGVRGLSVPEAAEARPVLLDAQVTCIGPDGQGIFILDANEGTYVHRLGEVEALTPLKPGDWVRVDGYTIEGEFYPAVNAHTVKVLRWAPLPDARPFRIDEMYTQSSDCDWVSAEGRLTGAYAESEIHQRIMLTLEMEGSIEIGVQAVLSDTVRDKLPRLMFQRVRFNAVLGTLYNAQRQLTGRELHINSINDIEPLAEEASQEEVQRLTIHELMRVGMDHRKPVQTEGQVTYASPGEIFLRGDGASLRVAVLDGVNVQVGQRVRVEGFVWPQPISPAFRARRVRVLDAVGFDPEPVPVKLKDLLGSGRPEDLLDARMNYELVRIQAQLVDIGKSFGRSPDTQGDSEQLSLLCRAEGHLFKARLPVGMEAGKQLRPGAILQLTGICNLVQNKRWQWRLYFEGLWMQVRNEEDVAVLVPAPWWTPVRMVWVAGAALGCSVLFFSWVVALRKTVASQTNTIGKQIQRETTLNERQRIARELHDTLEQGLAALSLQLTRIRRKVQNDAPVELPSVETAEGMLRACREESRASIRDLRGGPLEEMELPTVIERTVAPQFEGTGIDFRIEVNGAVQRLTLFAKHQLVRLATEAARNAVRHADPKRFSIRMAYAGDSLCVDIEDDGCGFDPVEAELSGRFGVLGMRERANRLHAALEIESRVGQGTRLTLSVPVKEFLKEVSL